MEKQNPHIGNENFNNMKSIEKEIRKTSPTFFQALSDYIDSKDMKDADVYNRAHVDRKIFSKLRKGQNPSKKTAIGLAIALKLDFDETNNLLNLAGYALSPSIPFDMIVAKAINHKEYDIDIINKTLYLYDLPLLGV